MTPYFTDVRAGITIWNADCREVLPTLPDGSVDHVITEPEGWRSGEDGPQCGECGKAAAGEKRS